MDFVIGLVVGAFISFFYWRSVVIAAIEKTLGEIHNHDDNVIEEKKTLLVTVEQEGDVFLLYKQGSNNFVMQGQSLQDFQQRLKQLQIDELQIVNGKSEAANHLVAISKKIKEKNENSGV